MMTPTATELMDLVIDWIKQNKLPTDDDNSTILSNTDLVTSGLLDSLGLVELIQFIETQVGCRIDLMDVEPNEFTVLGDLCNIGLRSRRSAASTVVH
jgi:acyl carrier protein